MRFRSVAVLYGLASMIPALGMEKDRYGKLPLAFEPNLGQTDERVRFLVRTPGATVFFCDTEAVLVLQRADSRNRGLRDSRQVTQSAVRMRLAGAKRPRAAEGLDALPGVSNYYLGNNSHRWVAGVPQFRRIAYREIYAGVDLIAYGNQRNLEYDFVVAPGADPRQVELAWEGLDGITLSSEGDLVLRTALGPILQKRPRVYQDTPSGRMEVAATYTLTRTGRVGFAMARYDRRRPLIIDPQLVYSTYLGGISADQGFAIAVDSSGAAYVTGATPSSDFPLHLPLKTTVGSLDAFVTKIDAAGTSLTYSTFLGGGGNDKGLAIAVDSSGAAYVTGTTLANNFPTLTPIQALLAGSWDAFVTKLSPSGALSYSTYLGGTGLDTGQGIAVDSTGAAYVTGFTLSGDFPAQSTAYQPHSRGGYDSFVVKVAPAGTSLLYSTYLGGTQDDQAQAIALDSSGAAYVAGTTDSPDFPTVSPFQASLNIIRDIFVTKVAPSGAALVYSTYVGGSGSDTAFGIAVDSSGSAYVAGKTLSGNFPVLNAYQPTPGGNSDVVVFKLAPAGNALVYSTYVGGALDEAGWAIAVDGVGSAYVAGWTQSTNFPTVAPFQTDQGADDAFAFKLNPSGNALVYSTYLGGSSNDYAQGIALDPTEAAYVIGWTDSTDFPLKGALLGDQPTTDAFVTKIEPVTLPIGKAQLISPTPGSTFGGNSVTFTWTSVPGATAYALGVGTGVRNFDIFDQALGLATSQTVTGIPTNGSTIFVSVVTLFNGDILFNDYTFKAFNNGNKGVITSPVPGSVLPGATVTFTWLLGTGASSHQLDVGTAPGLGDLFTKNVGLTTSQVVTGLPTNGSTIYVRLTTHQGSLTFFNDYTYTAAGGATGLRFVPIMPCRIADTRDPPGPFGGPAISGGATRDFVIRTSACNVPVNAQAYSLNVAVIPAGPLGFLTLWPAGQTQPVASTLNSLDGRVKSNAAIVPAGTGEAISVFASNPTGLVLDINGYFVPVTDPTALAFYPVTPCRIADTRSPVGPLAGPSLTGGVSRTFPILSAGCGIPSTAKAYSLNFTAVPSGPLGYLTAWATGQSQPAVASLNALTGAVTANAAIVPAGTAGGVDIFASNTTDLVIDINGYFAPIAAGGLSLYNVSPCRVLDSRNPPGTAPFSGKKDVAVGGGSCGVPIAAQAFVLSATAVPPAPLGYLTLWPQGLVQPLASTLNALDSQVTSNLAIVPSANGSISAFASNPTYLILDVFGYFAP